MAACGSSDPSQRSSGRATKGTLFAAALNYSRCMRSDVTQCMRQHGITGFPDPTLTAPPNPADYSTAIDRNGLVSAIAKSIDTSSPAFKQAAT
jgi:hypothetical protein